MKRIHAVIVFTDDAGEALWGHGKPFEATKGRDPDAGFIIPIPVPAFSIRRVIGSTLDVHVDT